MSFETVAAFIGGIIGVIWTVSMITRDNYFKYIRKQNEELAEELNKLKIHLNKQDESLIETANILAERTKKTAMALCEKVEITQLKMDQNGLLTKELINELVKVIEKAQIDRNILIKDHEEIIKILKK